MAAIKKVALAGATGAMGTPILHALIKANYDVTVFTRSDKTTVPAGAKVAVVDYTDVSSLTAALKGQDALISAITITATDQQRNMVDAAIEAGVRRIIPSEFGSDMSNPNARALPVFQGKVVIADYLKEKTKGTETSYTLVYNNAFLDWGIEQKFLIDIKAKTMEILDGGNNPFATAPVGFVANAVVSILQHLDETANRGVKVQGIILTQQKLLDIAQSVVGTEGWQIKEASSEEVGKQAWKTFKETPENAVAWIVGFLNQAIYSPGFGGDFAGGNDNALLGLQGLTEGEVVEIVKSLA